MSQYRQGPCSEEACRPAEGTDGEHIVRWWGKHSGVDHGGALSPAGGGRHERPVKRWSVVFALRSKG